MTTALPRASTARHLRRQHQEGKPIPDMLGDDEHPGPAANLGSPLTARQRGDLMSETRTNKHDRPGPHRRSQKLLGGPYDAEHYGTWALPATIVCDDHGEFIVHSVEGAVQTESNDINE